MFRSAPSRRHNLFEITTPASSVNHCPMIGDTPRPRASDGVTAAPVTWCGSPWNVRLKKPNRNQPNTSKLLVRRWYSSRSGHECAEYWPGSLNLAPYTATNRSPFAYGSGASITPCTTV